MPLASVDDVHTGSCAVSVMSPTGNRFRVMSNNSSPAESAFTVSMIDRFGFACRRNGTTMRSKVGRARTPTVRRPVSGMRF